MSELDKLIAEQARDASTDTISPEFPWQVAFTDRLSNCVGMDADGEIVTNWPRPTRGTLLIGSATWHGTYGGYKNYKCRCVPCKKANSVYVSVGRQKSARNGA